MTQDAVAERTGINRSTLIRVEKAERPPLRQTLIALLNLYAVEGDERNALLALADNANETEWVRLLRDELPSPYGTFIDLESEACSIRSYQPGLIPGLLQTEGYARAQARAALPQATDTEIEARVIARNERQAAFAERDAHLFAIITEAALWWQVGGPEVQRGQLLRLLDALESRHVSLGVVPFNAGAHPSMTASFAILDFDHDPAVVYTENAGGAVFLEDSADVDGFRGIYERLDVIALDPTISHRLIAATLREIQERDSHNDPRRRVADKLL
jgi:transcriptional regulator with XRE-family HTH domain